MGRERTYYVYIMASKGRDHLRGRYRILDGARAAASGGRGWRIYP